MFSRYIPCSVKYLQRDIINYKKLSFLQRLLRKVFLDCDVIVVTPESLPKLYAYAHSVCAKNNVPMPVIFISRKKTLFNTAAQKLFASSGGILIGQQLIYDTTDDELEAVIADEIGHIKDNHANKTILTQIITYILGAYVLETVLSNSLCNDQIKKYGAHTKGIFAYIISKLCTALLINKRYEQEADQCAFQVHKADGLIKFFDRLIALEKLSDNEYDRTKNMITLHKENFGSFLYYRFLLSYYAKKTRHLIRKGYDWLCHNTPLGSHPSHEKRIETALEYLQTKNSP